MLRAHAEGWTCEEDKESMAEKVGKEPSGALLYYKSKVRMYFKE